MIQCSTYSNRLFGCSYYKQENNYAKTLDLFIRKIIVQYKNSSDVGIPDNLFNILSTEFAKRSWGGTRLVYKEDRKTFEDLCTSCAENLQAFFRDSNPTSLLEEYTYRHRVNGYIGCQIQREGKTYNVDFSVSESKDTFYRLYYHRFNNHLFNTVSGTDHDMVVFMIPNGKYYSLPWHASDYTTSHGMLSQTISRRTHRPGHQCLTCKITDCKPRLINDIGRL